MHGGAQLVSAAGVKCMCTRHVKSGPNLKSMNAKNTTKSPIHENADTNITCDFGVGDISRSRSRLPTHTATRPHTHTSLAGLQLDKHQAVVPKRFLR